MAKEAYAFIVLAEGASIGKRFVLRQKTRSLLPTNGIRKKDDVRLS